MMEAPKKIWVERPTRTVSDNAVSLLVSTEPISPSMGPYVLITPQLERVIELARQGPPTFDRHTELTAAVYDYALSETLPPPTPADHPEPGRGGGGSPEDERLTALEARVAALEAERAAPPPPTPAPAADWDDAAMERALYAYNTRFGYAPKTRMLAALRAAGPPERDVSVLVEALEHIRHYTNDWMRPAANKAAKALAKWRGE